MEKTSYISKIKSLVSRDGAIAIVFTIVLIIVLSIGSRLFWSSDNLDSLMTSIAPNTIVSFGMMLLLILGYFDLSVGAIMAMVGILVSNMFSAGIGVIPAILIGLLIGAAAGTLNGLLVGVIGINPLIATVGTQFIFQGIAYMRMSSIYQEVAAFPESFLKIGSGKFLGVYYQFWIMLILLVVISLILKYTRTGRKLFFVGGNRNAAEQMGFSSKRIILLTYIITGIFCALAAILCISRYGNANRYLGSGVHMTAIIACVVGGGTFAGGKGNLAGALFGCAFMSLVTNFFNLFEVSSTWQNVVVGAILVLVVTVDGYMNLLKMRDLGKI